MFRKRQNIDPKNFTDSQLLEQYQAKEDMAALGILYNRYLDLLFGVALKYLQNQADAEDAVMNVFELVSKKLKNHQVENIKSWLHVVTKNHCLEKIRKNKKTLTVVGQAEIMQFESITHHVDEFEMEWIENGQEKSLNECIKLLPAEQKQAIKMFYLEGNSYQDVAATTGFTVNKVRSYIQNGRRNLKICIEKKNG